VIAILQHTVHHLVATFALVMIQPPAHWQHRESALDPASPGAHRVAELWWMMFWISVAVYVIVLVYLGYAVMSRRRAMRGGDVTRVGGENIRKATATATRLVSVATGITVIILFVTLLLDFFVGRANRLPDPSVRALHIELIGHQWWWEATYLRDTAQQQVSASNELHVPVGVPVLFTMTSRDVIHSFWVPNLTGKSDLIPGHRSAAWFRADTPGVYRGQCAEFCGLQHAKMALWIVAEPQGQFNQWYAAQLAPAAEPSDSLRAAGQRVFMAGTCSNCHAIRGTSAGGRVGPELTHVGSQMTIAAGALPNTATHLAAWIADPQRIKPGNNMPPSDVAPDELRALVAYLRGLQ